MWRHFYYSSHYFILNQADGPAYTEQKQHKTQKDTVSILMDWNNLQKKITTLMMSVFHDGPPSHSNLQNPQYTVLKPCSTSNQYVL